jgi:hypothetical protein
MPTGMISDDDHEPTMKLPGGDLYRDGLRLLMSRIQSLVHEDGLTEEKLAALRDTLAAEAAVSAPGSADALRLRQAMELCEYLLSGTPLPIAQPPEAVE